MIEIPGTMEDPAMRNAFYTTLCRLKREGLVELAYQDVPSSGRYKVGKNFYRITNLGKDHLRRELARPVAA